MNRWWSSQHFQCQPTKKIPALVWLEVEKTQKSKYKNTHPWREKEAHREVSKLKERCRERYKIQAKQDVGRLAQHRYLAVANTLGAPQTQLKQRASQQQG
mmetsp:Transcript_48763/g.122694  ORF Transcript_48763/g.122694 Transcript_48763/m.122694 type:complete len:100 (+) Transcript_48763:812-1111(+)